MVIHGVVYDFVNKLLKNSSKLKILGDGNQVKSYLDVNDGIEGVIRIPDLHNESSSIFNLGHYQTMNVKDLADIVGDEMELSDVEYEYAGGERGWLGDSPFVHLDIKKANNYGWEPKITIEDSIRNTVRYLLSKDSRRFR